MLDPAIVTAVLLVGAAFAQSVRRCRGRLRDTLGRIAELERERTPVAIHRVSRSLGDSLDGCAAMDVALGTLVDALDGAAGRARLAGSFHAQIFEAVPHRPGAGDATALLAVERAALAGRGGHEFHDGWWALGAPLLAASEPIGAVSVCRRDLAFSGQEEHLFGYLAAQIAASLEAIALHELAAERDFRDTLMGLGTRSRFQEALEQRVEEALSSGRPLSVLVLDLDDFTRVNAAFGHAAGDEVLAAVGHVVRGHCLMTDEPARLGGQHIAVALPGADLDGAWAMAENLRSDIAALGLRLATGEVAVTASAGIVELSSRVANSEGLIVAAESALDEAKWAGKNRTVGFRGPYRTDDKWLRRLGSR